MLAMMATWGGGLLLGWAALNVSALVGRQALVVRRERRYVEQTRAQFAQQLVGARRRAADRPRPSSMGEAWQPLRVKWHIRESRDCYSLYLTRVDGGKLPAFLPGQFLTFRLPVPGAPQPVVRCYSLSDAPHKDYYRVTVKEVVPAGKASSYLAKHVAEGAVLEVKPPSGTFHLDTESQQPVCLVGAGIGLTPLLSMLNYVARSQPQRPVMLFYGTRDGDHHPFRQHLQQLAARNPHVRLVTCYSKPTSRDQAGRDYSIVGRVNLDLLRPLLSIPTMQYYVCGPSEFMQSIVSGLQAAGVEAERLHFEAFGPSTVSMQPQRSPALPAQAWHRVQFVQSEREGLWDGTQTSLLELGEKAGVPIASGCRAGSCGTCLLRLRSGSVTYAHEPSQPLDPQTCLACVAVPTSDLVVEA